MTDTPNFFSRIRPEGSIYAQRNKQTGNWFRHDDNDDLDLSNCLTVRSVSNTPRIMSSRQQNNRDHHHHHQQQQQSINADAHQNTRKQFNLADQSTNWYNHEKNKNYRPPLNVRLRSDDAKTIKQKQETQSYTSSNHNNNNNSNIVNIDAIGSDNIIFSRSGINRNQVELNSNKIRGKHQTPNWFTHPENGELNEEGKQDGDEEGELDKPLKTRLTNGDALAYKERNVNGYAGDYMVQDENFAENDNVETTDWRPESRVGAHPRAESDVWFLHEEQSDHRPPTAARPLRCPSRVARETYERSQGREMLKIFQHCTSTDSSNKSENLSIPDDATSNVERVENPVQHKHNDGRPYMNEAHRRNVVGSMKSVLNQNENDSYVDKPHFQRAVKPEGVAISEKNRRGVMDECMKGYLDNAPAKQIHKTANVSEDFLKMQKGQNMALALVGDLPAANKFQALRTIKPEGLANAKRNQGSIKNVFNNLTASQNNLDDDKQVGQQRLKSREAKAIAKRYHYGSMKSLLR
ncbi:hypothetical protein HELRODRAFT_164699 [Helobdella robusta]|uniref:Uncharacterized protein n=1 Tax=Helobdella robusta TaxID=6412 RepID=T1EVQ8_HELRO|nr:hypothetical protein HELRODRAFT_164699 [Helobdella robusta]ESN92623.1 hypothetical protein HELRODRAFT_164699 [Helobdella robusta]